MDDDRTLFVGNIDKNVTEEILYELFLQAGPVERVSIPSTRNDYARYGFITYKHESSISYAIDLFKGTVLFKKELSIKKRSPKNNTNSDSNKSDAIPDAQRAIPNILDFHGQLNTLKFLAQNLTYGTQPLVNFTPNLPWENNPGRNRSYDVGMKNYFSRPREVRERRKDRNYSNKMYHGRKNRHRD